jgi:hypothetical protein
LLLLVFAAAAAAAAAVLLFSTYWYSDPSAAERMLAVSCFNSTGSVQMEGNFLWLCLMGKRKPAEDDAVGSAEAVLAFAFALPVAVAVVVGLDFNDVGVASLLVAAAAGAADDRDRMVVTEVMVLCGRCRSCTARRRNILIGAIVQ